MSHFTVMVIGNNPEDQLAPYDETIETEPRDTGEVPQSEIDSMIEHYKEKENGGLDLPFDELYELKGDKWNGGTWVKQPDGTYHEFTTYNPNSKWDWYQLGGRWADYLKLKRGAKGDYGSPSLLMDNFKRKSGYADSAMKKDIDIKKMRDDAGKAAGKTYDKARKIIDKNPPITSWEVIRKKHTKDDTDFTDISLARKEYGDQPCIVEFRENSKDFGFFTSPEDFLMTREEYVENARNSAISTFAVLKDGVWYEKGKMGWWGMSDDKMSQSEWDNKIMELLNSVPDDTLISIYDCHI